MHGQGAGRHHGGPTGPRRAQRPPPRQVTSQDGKAQRVAAWAGPWPLDERWWRPAAHRRQARFQLVLKDGSAHLCVLESNHWHREATYD